MQLTKPTGSNNLKSGWFVSLLDRIEQLRSEIALVNVARLRPSQLDYERWRPLRSQDFVETQPFVRSDPSC